ncbi:S-methyl-5'-thioadenosine phosphorylase [Williamsia sp. SKLECPSW1]
MSSTPQDDAPAIGVIGGTGFYSFFDDEARDVVVDTPFGAPSAPISIGTVNGVRVAFVPRHGRDHEYPPHKVPYRATMWALRSLGVRRVLAPCAVGSLTPDIGPGAVVVPDQLVDRTSGREHTVFDTSAVHVSFADPYCPVLRGHARDAANAAEAKPPVVDGGTMVVVEGPRFSTRAESHWFAAQGWTLVNMTGHPEAVLARELQMCYSAIALVTDLDAGVTEGEGVSEAEVYAVFKESLQMLKGLLSHAVALVDADPAAADCDCAAGGHDLEALMAGSR